jgi:hypothetical protein
MSVFSSLAMVGFDPCNMQLCVISLSVAKKELSLHETPQVSFQGLGLPFVVLNTGPLHWTNKA